MEQEHVAHLKREIERILGRKIVTSSDCRHLFNDIQSKLNHQVSFNTLRRVFNLMKAEHKQSLYTLDVLSVYCGFDSYADFVKNGIKRTPKPDDLQDSNLLRFLIMIFKDVEVYEMHDHTFYNLVEQTCHYLNNHPSLIDEFQREVARTENGRRFYFEYFVNTDKLNHSFGAGLRYYMARTKKKHELAFGHYLLCFKAWLTLDTSSVQKHAAQIALYNLRNSDNPFMVALHFSSALYAMDAAMGSTETMSEEIRNYFLNLHTTKDNFLLVYRALVTVAEAQLHADLYDDVVLLSEEAFKIAKSYRLPLDATRRLPLLHLIYATALYHTGEIAKSREVFARLDPVRFYFPCKQYMSILYLDLKQHLFKRKTEASLLQNLILETGFARLCDPVVLRQEELDKPDAVSSIPML